MPFHHTKEYTEVSFCIPVKKTQKSNLTVLVSTSKITQYKVQAICISQAVVKFTFFYLTHKSCVNVE